MTKPATAKRTGAKLPRILVTNDDGINAPGLRVLERVAHSLSDDVWVVAPETNQSGASHSLTMSRPLRIRKLSKRRFAIDGTPTDCVLLALQIVIKDGPVGLVLSGVNHGSNLGEDVTYSGTIAAAMEATLFNIPAIAMSQVCRNGHRAKWATAEHRTAHDGGVQHLGPTHVHPEAGSAVHLGRGIETRPGGADQAKFLGLFEEYGRGHRLRASPAGDRRQRRGPDARPEPGRSRGRG